MRFDLPQDRLPTAWYNALARLDEPLQPPLHPGTREPLGPEDLAPLFPMALIEQEMSPAPWIDVPGEVLDILRLWRPTPLVRAVRLEQELGTPARIYFKDESVSPAGSHKPNTAVAQAFYNKAEGVTRLTPRPGPASGARPWPSPPRSTASTARSTWCGRRTNPSPTAGC
jgi:tryptophan synthase beta chain